jgi:hypothetical protein
MEAAGDAIASRYHSEGILAASFFFRRSGSKSSIKFLVTTLAYRLCLTLPILRFHILGALYADPDILEHSANMEKQLKELILDPLEKNKEQLAQDGVKVILLDSLHHCPNSYVIAVALASALRNLKQSAPALRIIITGRLDRDISVAFDQPDIASFLNVISLDGKNHILPPGLWRMHLDFLDLFNRNFRDGRYQGNIPLALLRISVVIVASLARIIFLLFVRLLTAIYNVWILPPVLLVVYNRQQIFRSSKTMLISFWHSIY